MAPDVDAGDDAQPSTGPAVADVQRWLVSLQLVLAAEDALQRGGTTDPTVAVILADAAAETALGTLAGDAASEHWDTLLNAAIAAVRAVPQPWPQTLGRQLKAARRARNTAVHHGIDQAESTAQLSIDASRRLIALLPVATPGIPATSPGMTIVGAVAAAVSAAAEVADNLSRADAAARRRDWPAALEGAAIALYLAQAQSVPEIRDRQRFGAGGLYRLERDLRQLVEPLGASISRLDAWVTPMALGMRPVDHARMLDALGRVVETLGGISVTPADPAPGPDEARWAVEHVSLVIFRLWQMGTLYRGGREAFINRPSRWRRRG